MIAPDVGWFGAFLVLSACSVGCASDPDDGAVRGTDPSSAPRALVDRFGPAAATLMLRTADNGLPEAGEPIDFDQGPFVSQGLGPEGQVVRYYNFDVQAGSPAPLYLLVRDGEPVTDQLPIVDVLPGAAGYSDFFRVIEVAVPDGYIANSVTSFAGIEDRGLTLTPTDRVVNQPLVPEGSTATEHSDGGPTELTELWYRGQVAHALVFEQDVSTNANAAGQLTVDVAYIFVTFNINPGAEGGGLASGFVTEAGGKQSHNVVEFVPSDAGYTPLWQVMVYDNADFDVVSDFATAMEATLIEGVGGDRVNCPVVFVSD